MMNHLILNICKFCFAFLALVIFPLYAAEPIATPVASTPLVSPESPSPVTPQPSPQISPQTLGTPKPAASSGTFKATSVDAEVSAPLSIDHIEKSTVYFRGGPSGKETPPLSLDASNMTPIGMLRAVSGGNPYFLVYGRPCKECVAESMILAFQATSPKLYKYVGPGRVIDHKTHSVVMESRAFWGRCLMRKSEDVLVVFQKERVDRKRAPQASVFFAEPAVDAVQAGKPLEHLHETLLERHEPRIADTFKLIRSKACHEIESHDRMTARHPIDLNLKRQKLIEEESEDSAGDESTRENQTDQDSAPNSKR